MALCAQRLGRLVVVVGLAAMLGALGPAGGTAFAALLSNSTTVCTARASTIACTLTIGPLDGGTLLPGGVTVRLGGNADFVTSAPPVIVAGGSAPCAAASGPAALTNRTFVVNVSSAGCPAGSTITINETLTPSAPGGGPLTQTVSSPLFFPVTLTARTPAGVALTIPDVFGASVGVCAPSGAVITCTLTLGPLIALPAGVPVTVTLTGPGVPGTPPRAAFTTGGIGRAGGGCATTDPAGVTDTAFFVTTTELCSGLDAIVLTETLTVTGAGAGLPGLCQTITSVLSNPVTVCTTTPEGAPFVAPAAPAGAAPVSATSSCTPAADTVPSPATQVRAGGTLTCTVSVTAANGAAGITGAATVTLTGAVFLGDGDTATFSCEPPGTATTPPTCRFGETISPAVACLTPTQTVALLGATFALPAVNAAGDPIQVLPGAGSSLACPAPALSLTQPAGLAISCATSANLLPLLGDLTAAPSPGRTGGRPLAAAGALPESVRCRVRLVDGAGRLVAAAPGAIRVTATSGGLLDAAGKSATNLRIDCTDDSVSPSVCSGAQFDIAGAAVSIVEVRARYEPAPPAARTGITPVEETASVGFVAPPVTLAVEIGANPVIPGATGTVTARLKAATACTSVRCVDPATGAALRIRPGSVLNGSVIFTLENPAVASWTGAAGGATQMVVRCGRARNGATSGLAAYFRGCAAASASFRGVAFGETDITATFVPDLPGAASAGAAGYGLPSSLAALVSIIAGASTFTDYDTLEVVPPGP